MWSDPDPRKEARVLEQSDFQVLVGREDVLEFPWEDEPADECLEMRCASL